MRIARVTFCSAWGLAWAGVLGASDALPPFSWDHVPVYAHVAKSSGDFTPAELDFLAEHFDFITIEKGQGSQQHGSTEAGFTVAAREIKQRNGRAKVLFYWNASLDSASTHDYQAIGTFPADGYLKDDDGKLVLRRKKLLNYDLTRADVRDWWSDAVLKAVREYGADGIFADEMAQHRGNELGEEKINELLAARVKLLAETRRKIGPDKLIVYNGLMRDDPDPLLRHADGAMIEVFGHPTFGEDSKEQYVAFFEATQAAAKKGKIVLLKGWPGFSFIQADMMAKPHEELAHLARERLTFPLACFLIAAEPNCYFSYTWGYRENGGTFDWYPEFDRPLGPPLGAAKKDGWSYAREFAHASVSVNLASKTAAIDWK